MPATQEIRANEHEPADKFVHPIVKNNGATKHGNGIVRVAPVQQDAAGVNTLPGGNVLISGQQHTGHPADVVCVQLASKLAPHAHGTSGGQEGLYSLTKYFQAVRVAEPPLQQSAAAPDIR